MANPIAFNPETMTLNQVKHISNTLRTVFELLERTVTAEDIQSFLEQSRDNMLKQWGEPK